MSTVRNTEPVAGRNDPCPCGSGVKHKRCCLPKREAEEAAKRNKMRLRFHSSDTGRPMRHYGQTVAMMGMLAYAGYFDDDVAQYQHRSMRRRNRGRSR